MNFSPARWAALVTAAALIALPGSALAQTPPQNPPSQPPTQTQPPSQPPSTPPQTQPAAAPANPQVDAAAAKQHLTEARDALSQITSMPEASKLQGDARTKVSELISNFNALITAQSDWRSAYAKVNDNLTALIGPDTDQSQTQSTTGAVGTTGTSSAQLDPAIRAKLVEFGTHLKAFEKSAGGAQPSASSPEPAASSAMPPAAAAASTSNPANPASAANPPSANPRSANPPSEATPPSAANPPSATSGAVGTTGTADQNVNQAAQSELAAIDAILNKSKTGALTKAQTAQLRSHVEALRSLLNQKK